MNRQQLVEQIFNKKTFLCVGLDADIKKVPSHLLKEEDPIYSFNKAIIDATADYCVAYKPNLAFYERHEWQKQILFLRHDVRLFYQSLLFYSEYSKMTAFHHRP